MPFGQELSPNDAWFFELSNVDEWENGSARFSTQVELNTTTLPQAMPPKTLWRLASHMILNRLDGDTLKQAFESLADIYVWQTERAQIVFSEPAIEIVQRSPTVQYVERRPFDYPE